MHYVYTWGLCSLKNRFRRVPLWLTFRPILSPHWRLPRKIQLFLRLWLGRCGIRYFKQVPSRLSLRSLSHWALLAFLGWWWVIVKLVSFVKLVRVWLDFLWINVERQIINHVLNVLWVWQNIQSSKSRICKHPFVWDLFSKEQFVVNLPSI